MQLHTIHSKNIRRNKKRVGRGGRRGTYSGRGQKGQSAHGGRKRPDPVRSMVMKMPKLRGLKHPAIREASRAVSLSTLERLAGKGEVTKELLIRERVVRDGKTPIKILASGEISKPVVVRGIACSKAAREKIEKAGGSVG